MNGPRILILGGGFGGIRCALDCARKLRGRATVTLVDRNAHHTFTPALYEIASAYQPGDDPFALELRRAVAIPYKDIFEGQGVDFIQAEIVSVDLVASRAVLDGGAHLDFDYAVFALGAQASDMGVSGVREYAYQFKTTDDAVALHNKLETLFRGAVEGKVSLPIKFLVIGGGFTGVELSAELMTCAQRLSRHYGFNRRAFSAVLFEAGPTILPMIRETERKKIMARLTDLGVAVMTNSAIEDVLSDSVKLKTGQTITGAAVVWTAGVRANQLLRAVHGLLGTDKGQLIVDENLRIKNFDKLFALGDCVEFIDKKTQRPIPGLAHVAQAQAHVIADNIYRAIHNKKSRPYLPDYNYWVAPVGGKFAMASLSGFGTYSGFLGWIIRALVDLRYFFSILSLPKTMKLFGKNLMLFSKND